MYVCARSMAITRQPGCSSVVKPYDLIRCTSARNLPHAMQPAVLIAGRAGRAHCWHSYGLFGRHALSMSITARVLPCVTTRRGHDAGRVTSSTPSTHGRAWPHPQAQYRGVLAPDLEIECDGLARDEVSAVRVQHDRKTKQHVGSRQAHVLEDRTPDSGPVRRSTRLQCRPDQTSQHYTNYADAFFARSLFQRAGCFGYQASSFMKPSSGEKAPVHRSSTSQACRSDNSMGSTLQRARALDFSPSSLTILSTSLPP